jgi:hypothetical protein
MKQSIAAVPGDFLQSRASGSVTDTWVAFERFSPRKFTSALRVWRAVSGIGRVSVCGGWSVLAEVSSAGGGGPPGSSSSSVALPSSG